MPLSTLRAQAPDPSTAPAAMPRVEPRRILIADDNQDAAESLATLLTLGGHDVRVAGDGIEALAIANLFEPDVVLLDLGMPRMDGYEAARQMTNVGPALVKPVSDFDLLQALADADSGRAQGTTKTTAG